MRGVSIHSIIIAILCMLNGCGSHQASPASPAAIRTGNVRLTFRIPSRVSRTITAESTDLIVTATTAAGDAVQEGQSIPAGAGTQTVSFDLHLVSGKSWHIHAYSLQVESSSGNVLALTGHGGGDIAVQPGKDNSLTINIVPLQRMATTWCAQSSTGTELKIINFNGGSAQQAVILTPLTAGVSWTLTCAHTNPNGASWASVSPASTDAVYPAQATVNVIKTGTPLAVFDPSILTISGDGGQGVIEIGIVPDNQLVGVTVHVAPATATLAPTATQQFTAIVTGTANTAVTWSVTDNAGNLVSGVITVDGLFTAPATTGLYTVKATNVADITKFATAIVTVSTSPQNRDMVWVPGGSFTMGTPYGARWDQPYTQQVTLSGYWIDKYEVTVAQYFAFCTATGRALPMFPSGYSWAGKSGWADPALQQHPIVYVSWYDAKAYADWAGMQLPTEAQWEYAARGPQGNNFPWGGTATEGQGISGWYNGWDQTKCANYYNSREQNISTWPVGSFPIGASWCGAQDLAGNVWEWCMDWYDNYSATPVIDPTGPPTGTVRIMRGGSWYGDYDGGNGYAGTMYGGDRSAFRNRCDPYNSGYNLGFRCVSSLP